MMVYTLLAKIWWELSYTRCAIKPITALKPPDNVPS